MTVKEQDLTLSTLIQKYPEYTHQIRLAYSASALFREIANEYAECLEQEKAHRSSAEVHKVYKETLDELNEEIRAYLMGLKSDNPVERMT